jgi:dTDP-4-amino-4,6-dideoxygalactose transaminase
VNGKRLKSKDYEYYRTFGMTRMYPESVNNIEEIRGSFIGKNCKNAESIAKDLMTLPTHALLRDRDVMNICNILKSQENERSACSFRMRTIEK